MIPVHDAIPAADGEPLTGLEVTSPLLTEADTAIGRSSTRATSSGHLPEHGQVIKTLCGATLRALPLDLFRLRTARHVRETSGGEEGKRQGPGEKM